MLLRDALAHSKNTVSAKLVDALGPEAVIDFARRAGIESELPRTLSLALGTGEVTPLELVNGYATLAAGGFPAPPILVTRVRDRNGTILEETRPREAPPLPEATPSPPPPEGPQGETAQAGVPGGEPTPPAPAAAPTAVGRLPDRIRPETAYVTVAMMKEVVQSGTGQAAKALDRPVAAKTGTAQEHRDAWFVGMTPDLVAGVWVGFDNHDPLGPHATGAGAALPGWLGFMQAAVGGRPAIDFAVPPAIEMARIDPKTGLLSPGASDGVLLPFLPGTAPRRTSAEPASAPQNFFQDDH
jgi:penicillin-binding protein 1A